MTKYFLAIIVFIFQFSCKSPNNQNNTISDIETIIDTNTEIITNNVSQHFDTIRLVDDTNSTPKLSFNTKLINCPIFENYDLLSPTTFFKEITIADANFDYCYPLNIKNKTQTTYNKSIIVGVYIADLVYSTNFKNKKLATDYYLALIKASDELWTNEFFQKNEFDFIQKSTDFDEILALINSSVQNLFLQLDKNKNYQSLPFVLYGSWLESVFLLSKNVFYSDNSLNESYIQIYNQIQIAKNMVSYLKNILVDTDNYELNLNIQNIISELQYFIDKVANLFPNQTNTDANYQISYDNLSLFVDILSEIRANIDKTVDDKIQIQMSKPVN